MEGLKDNFVFKSTDEYFWKEEADVKNNTIREIDLSDERFRQLIAWSEYGWNDGTISITIEGTNGIFTRDIKDITIWNNFMIITWEPKKL